MENITYIGETNYQSKKLRFGIKKEDRSGHIYCIGKTGTGKSTLLLNMALSDILHGDGVCIIDPHGDLSKDILDYIPKQRVKDVIYFNATDKEHPVAFNPLHTVQRGEEYLVSSAIVTTLKKIWSDSWGPRLEHILRNTILSLAHHPDSTLLDIVPMLTSFDFRKKVLYAVSDSAIHDFWQKEFEPLSIQLKNEYISPIVNKVGLFATHPILRNIVGQSKSSIDIASVMNNKQILILNLSKGILGEEATQLLGSLIITQFQIAALQRGNVTTRPPYYLFIDEMHSFLTLSFADILSESRKYGLCLFLTHQFTDQVDEDILYAILGNVGTVITFRIGQRDALLLKQEFHPVFDEVDLVNLPRYSIYLKLLINGTTSQPFSACSLPLTHKKYYLKEEIVTHSRMVYAKEKMVVEGLAYEKRKEKIPGGEGGLFG
jgi:Type IV secretion-system coupling protein DNA-binding domain